MKRFLIISASLILLLNSCEEDNSDQAFDPTQDDGSISKSDPEVFLKIGSNLYYKYSDLELYDSSTHILYFRTNHSEFDNNSTSVFKFIINSDTIYTGDFWPSIRSDFPTRPFISTWPFWLQSHALWIDNRDNAKPDLRNESSIIQALKDRNLLHSGLLVVINSIQITNTQATLSFSVTNKDQSDLFILDPNKMGINLFHYFTNGLVFWKSANSQPFYVNVPSQAPSTYDSWKIDWLSKLNSNETKTFGFTYPLDSPIDPGEYNVTFDYPGLLFQISKDQLNQDNARVWLGKIKSSIKIVID